MGFIIAISFHVLFFQFVLSDCQIKFVSIRSDEFCIHIMVTTVRHIPVTFICNITLAYNVNNVLKNACLYAPCSNMFLTLMVYFSYTL